MCLDDLPMWKTFASWSLLLVLLVACGGSDSSNHGNGGDQQFSCAAGLPTADGGRGATAVCVDATGATTEDLERNRESCGAQVGAFSNELCNRTNAIGGCRITQGLMTLTTWYYRTPDSTGAEASDEELVNRMCAGLGLEFVIP